MIKTASGGGENALVTAVAVKYLHLLLADRASLRGHPALVNLAAYGAGKLNSGSATSQYTLWGLDGYDIMGTVAEGAEMSETALTNALKSITWARRGLRRDLSDDVRSLDATGQINPMRLANDGFASAMATLTAIVGALMNGFSNQVGTTGVGFTHDTFMAATGKLTDNLVEGPYLGLLWPTHFKAWKQDLEARGGLTQWRPAAAEMQVLKGPGFQGVYDGVDIFTTTRVPQSGSDRISGIFGRGAIGYVEQEVEYGPESIILLQDGPIAVELQRDGVGGNTRVVSNYRPGVAEIEDARGCGMLAAG